MRGGKELGWWGSGAVVTDTVVLMMETAFSPFPFFLPIIIFFFAFFAMTSRQREDRPITAPIIRPSFVCLPTPRATTVRSGTRKAWH